jgi:hypothetical protein
MVNRSILSLALAGSLLALASAPALAVPGLTLTYDSPTVTVAPGGSVDIGATLTVSNAFGPLNTDASGSFSDPSSTTTLSVAASDLVTCVQNCTSVAMAFGLPFVSTPNPLANLHVAAGSSVHIDLGTLTLSLFGEPLPGGVYQTDVGIDETVNVDMGDMICGCFTMVTPFAAPDIDAGPLTIDIGNPIVTNFALGPDAVTVPEPAGLGIFAVALAALAMIRRGGAGRRMSATPIQTA